MLETVPNITLEGTNKGAFQCPAIRGFTASNNLVLIDGIPMNTGFANWASALSLPSNNIDHIEVLRGPNTTVYGPNSMGGVINIITREPGKENPAHGDLRFGTHGLQRTLVSYGGKGPGIGYLLSVSRDDDDGYLPNTDMGSMHYSLRTDANVNGSELGLRTEYVDAHVGVPIDPNAPQRFDYWRNARASLAYRLQFSPGFSISSHAYINHEKSRLLVYSDTTFSAVSQDIHNLGTTIGGEVITNFIPSGGNLLTAGFQARRDQVDMAYVGGRKGSSIVGGFLQDVIDIPGRLTINFGLRADHHSISGNAVNADAGAIIRPFRGTGALPGPVIRASYGTSNRFPSLRELYMTSPAPGRGDSSLSRESSRGLELGVEQAIAGNNVARFTYFRTMAEDLIERDLTVKPWVFASLGAVRMEGIELEVERPADRLPGYFLALSTLNAREISSGEELDFRPSLRINMGIDESIGRLRLYATGRYTGIQRYKRKDPETGDTIREGVPDYFLLETRFVYDLSNYGEISLAVDNLLGEDYLVEGHQQATPVLPGRPREFTVGYSIEI